MSRKQRLTEALQQPEDLVAHCRKWNRQLLTVHLDLSESYTVALGPLTRGFHLRADAAMRHLNDAMQEIEELHDYAEALATEASPASDELRAAA